MAGKTTNTAEQALKNTEHSDLALSDAEMKKAQQEGAKEDVKETAKDAHHFMTDGVLPGEPDNKRQWHGHEEIQQWAHNLDLGEDALKERINAKPDNSNYIPDEKVYGLLALERNGKNRTEYVKAMMKRLGLKADELPGGGPDYTNDTTNISKL